MRIFRHYNEITPPFKGGVIALGNFDGVHIGHQTVIGTAIAASREMQIPCGVMTFEPHPQNLFSPELPPFRLTPFRIKARNIEALGIDFLLMQHFDHDFAGLTAEEFISDVLVSGLGIGRVVVGYDYSFGKGRGGNVAMLNETSRRHGFTVTVVGQATAEDGIIYSSQRIRESLQSGDPREATRILGRPWEIEGRVEHGDKRGRTIGFPTANIALGEYLHPAKGVYAVRAGIDHGIKTLWLNGVANIGERPTVGGNDTRLEAHLFDYRGDIYGMHMRVALIDALRPEQKFDGIDALKKQIAKDCKAAREILGRLYG